MSATPKEVKRGGESASEPSFSGQRACDNSRRTPLTSKVKARVGDLADWSGRVARLIDRAAKEAENGGGWNDCGQDEQRLEDEETLFECKRALRVDCGGAERGGVGVEERDQSGKRLRGWRSGPQLANGSERHTCTNADETRLGSRKLR